MEAFADGICPRWQNKYIYIVGRWRKCLSPAFSPFFQQCFLEASSPGFVKGFRVFISKYCEKKGGKLW